MSSNVGVVLFFASLVALCSAQVWEHNEHYKYKLISTTIRANALLNDSCSLAISEYLDVSFKNPGESVTITRTLPKYITAEGNPIKISNVAVTQILNGTELPSQINTTTSQDVQDGGTINIATIANPNGTRLLLSYTVAGYRVNIGEATDRISYSFQTDAEIEHMNLTVIYPVPAQFTDSMAWMKPAATLGVPGMLWIENKDPLDATKGWVVNAYIPSGEGCFYVDSESELTLALGISLPIATALLILVILIIEYVSDKVNTLRKSRTSEYATTAGSFRIRK
jgi:hypothetical protein